MLNCASILMVHIFMLILLFSPKMLFAADDEYPNNLFSSSRKKNKSLPLCIHYVYLSLAGGGSVLRMNISHSIVYTMAPFTVPIWPPVCDRGTVISNPWNASCSFNEFNIQQRGKKKKAICVFGYTYLLSHPLLLQIIITEVLIHGEKKEGKPCVCETVPTKFQALLDLRVSVLILFYKGKRKS